MGAEIIDVSNDSEIVDAISLMASEAFGAMRLMNALAGKDDGKWRLAHNYSLKELIDEAEKREIDFAEIKCAVTKTPLWKSAYYQHASGEIDEREVRKRIREMQNVGSW